MEKIVSKIVGFGIPGLFLMVAINATGLVGAAAITAGLSAFGPGGMIGGVATFLAVGVIGQALAEYGFDSIFKSVVKELYKRGESKESIIKKINHYPVSKSLKLKLLDSLNNID